MRVMMLSVVPSSVLTGAIAADECELTVYDEVVEVRADPERYDGAVPLKGGGAPRRLQSCAAIAGCRTAAPTAGRAAGAAG
jgi:hypothetical protein